MKNKLNNQKQMYLIGILICFGILFYSLYNIIYFELEYKLNCRDDFNTYDIVTTNFTEYNNTYHKCLNYSIHYRQMINKQNEIVINPLNFSLYLNNT